MRTGHDVGGEHPLQQPRPGACIRLLRETLIPACNQFGYGQVESPYGSGQFIKDLRSALGEEPKLVTSEVKTKDDIMDSIREFLKGGR